ncbi:hypothetical protein ACMGD3_10125 [Lysinibacillus sphaericus]|uniref:hypothetical protein n=1 Tax=Lysinibacillus sphaericus TaxID=1421 RepID=UPI001C60158C
MGLLFVIMGLLVLVVVISDLKKKLHKHDHAHNRRTNQSSTTTTDVMSTSAIVSLQDQDTAKQACSDTATSHSDTSSGSSFD